MAWIPPMTAVAGDVLTAADFNTSIRDNLLATCTAQATDPTVDGAHWFLTSGLGRVKAREMKQVVLDAGEHTMSTQWTDLETPGPITEAVHTSGSMLVQILCYAIMYRPLGAALMSFEVHSTDPATTVNTRIVIPADDARSIGYQRGDTGSYLDNQIGSMWLIEGLEPEAPYWVKLKYRIERGQDTGDNTARYDRRSVTVFAL